MNGLQVGILVDDERDLLMLQQAAQILDRFNISYEVRYLSAHFSPRAVSDYAARAHERGITVIIAASRGAANLAGVIASRTILPVIGVPLDTPSFSGLDSLLATVQMPAGIPVATTAIGAAGAENACLLASEILAIKDASLQQKLVRYRKEMASIVEEKGDRLRKQGYRSYPQEKNGSKSSLQ